MQPIFAVDAKKFCSLQTLKMKSINEIRNHKVIQRYKKIFEEKTERKKYI